MSYLLACYAASGLIALPSFRGVFLSPRSFAVRGRYAEGRSGSVSMRPSDLRSLSTLASKYGSIVVTAGFFDKMDGAPHHTQVGTYDIRSVDRSPDELSTLLRAMRAAGWTVNYEDRPQVRADGTPYPWTGPHVHAQHK